jgi:ribosomal protein S15P/S13E
MKLTTEQAYTEPQARREACDILTEEANQLANHLDGHADDQPHRVIIAISREIQRLRTIANALKGEE